MRTQNFVFFLVQNTTQLKLKTTVRAIVTTQPSLRKTYQCYQDKQRQQLCFSAVRNLHCPGPRKMNVTKRLLQSASSVRILIYVFVHIRASELVFQPPYEQMSLVVS